MTDGRVTDDAIAAFEAAVGAVNVLRDIPADYGRDEAYLLDAGAPALVIRPETTDAVSAVLRIANERGIAVTARGSGTGLSGGAIPEQGGIVLSLERMNTILEIDEDNFVAVVEPGVVLDDLYKATEERGLYYPVYPEEASAFIGGTIGTNAGGMKAIKYGITRDYVMGIEAVLADGTVLSLGGKYSKNSTGYDLRHLIIGSEGTLAIVTKIILKLIKKPARRGVLIPAYDSLEDAIKTVPLIFKSGIRPTAIEFMLGTAMSLCQDYTDIALGIPDAPYYLIIVTEGETQEEIHALSERIGALCLDCAANDIFIVEGERQIEDVMNVRASLAMAIKGFGTLDIGDAVVPRSAIPAFMQKLEAIGDAHGMMISGSGHAGDGNVHFAVIGMGLDEATFKDTASAAFRDVYAAAVELGGTISAEHGIGIAKKAYLPLALSAEHIALMKAIKKTFDPKGILNPGKIFDLEA